MAHLKRLEKDRNDQVKKISSAKKALFVNLLYFDKKPDKAIVSDVKTGVIPGNNSQYGEYDQDYRQNQQSGPQSIHGDKLVVNECLNEQAKY